MTTKPIWPEDTPDLKVEVVKYDTGKLPYHLVPPELLEGMCSVLDFGARKYTPRNWELGMDWSRPFSALMRHMWAWWRGESVDPETGMSHLWHAGCCIAFLIAYEQRGVGTDDRPIISKEKVDEEPSDGDGDFSRQLSFGFSRRA